MNLDYAVDRLYEIGWLPSSSTGMERLSDGRRYPTLAAVQKHFENSGLVLSFKQNDKFNCCQATWAPLGEEIDPRHAADERHGTVVGRCSSEAAVYAMAQLLAAQAETQLATA
jgi:hypothetical protein